MQVLTAAAAEAALDQDGCDDVVWLRSRAEIRALRRSALGRLDRGCETFARTTTLIGLGAVISAALPASASAPVATAHAAVERSAAVATVPAAFEELQPFDVEPADQAGRLAILGEVSPAERLREQRREVEDFLRFGSREVPRRIVEIVIRAANTTEVDPVYLMALADTESSFRPDVKAPTSSAEGMFQFVERTWLEVIRLYGAAHGAADAAAAVQIVDGRPLVADEAQKAEILARRRDPYLAAVMAAEMLKADAAMIGFRIGRRLNSTEMYLAHFLGLEQAGQFLTLREAKRPPMAARAFPAAARANVALFYARGRRGRRLPLSIEQVYGKIDRIIGTRTELYRDVTTAAVSGPV